MKQYLEGEFGEELLLLLLAAEREAQGDRGPGEQAQSHLVVQLRHIQLNLAAH